MNFVRTLPFAAVLLALVLSAMPTSRALGVATASISLPNDPVAEGNDYATQVLRDPWDMSQYSDVSLGMNNSGQILLLPDPRIEDGLFKATAVNANGGSFFFPLFPGFPPATADDEVISPEKSGHNYPIESARYRCFYAAMKVDAGAAQNGTTDSMRVFWMPNQSLGADGKPLGVAFEPLYPEAGQGQPVNSFRLYKIDLTTSSPSGFAAWNSQARWEGIRLDPTILRANTTFQIDWIRLTDCGAKNTTINFTPNGSVNAIWLRLAGTNRDIRVATGVNGGSGSYQLDVQGIDPGSYQVGLGTTTTCCIERSSELLTINQRPVATFARPSFTSGTDFAASAGNPWDFSDAADARVQVDRGSVTSAYTDGTLEIITPPGPLPAGVDVQTLLNVPTPVDPAVYRYLTFRMYTGWKVPWANITDGMIARWIWTIPGPGNDLRRTCTLVGGDITYDIGWQTYTVDLHDVMGGAVEETYGNCPKTLPNWKTSGGIIRLRFDPNENVTGEIDPITGGGAFTQRIDWIKLTRQDSVKRGATYVIALSLNKPASQVGGQTFYYTTDRNNPDQNTAVAYKGNAPSFKNKVYVPLINRGSDEVLGDLPNPVTFTWDTSNVTPGTYYVCARLNDGTNATTTCSEAPVTVTQ